ncbi:cold shock domain-containing protein [Paraglaciecola arctica]|uniref:CSD domain-containing protein n=1 Tax=Paraglaciecola arctica BSs20135 TaxID=493475 RepID=K6YTR9_9ALTE|nr:cold shock domain-containing protein [Paraglaciecola arctica]GAC21567.1 hypothetical protein GARC_4625 [Paraglaciecola arctica BSs20135]
MQGRIIRWNDDRGFGFISSKDCDGDVFAHMTCGVRFFELLITN